MTIIAIVNLNIVNMTLLLAKTCAYFAHYKIGVIV